MKTTYVGTDLEAMSFAENYHRWILSELRPYLGKSLVEVGAGTGSFSELLLECRPTSLILVEPSEMVSKLRERISTVKTGATLRILDSSFREVSDEIAGAKPDSVIYVNVLEHIEDDSAELAAVFDALAPGGRVFIFVPAHPWLYGAFDASVGHFRRYRRSELEQRTRAAGFEILVLKYFDFVGIAPWWVKYRLLRSAKLEPKAVELYDRWAVPVTRALESAFTPPTGKNLLMIGEKP
ncbi:MAG: class I SAM-dependent methyltransferase [Pyrinomonadaceae bacterium]